MSPSELANGRLLCEEIESGIVRLTINDPDRRNAMDLELIGAFDGALAKLAAGGGVRALIVAGQGTAFCAGFNIGKIGPLEDGSQEAARAYAEGRAESRVIAFMDRLEGFPAATIAMLNGHAFGVGGELAATCDFRLSGGQGLFGMPPAKLGLCYHHEGLRKFRDLAGLAVAKEMFFTGEPLSMKRAFEVGLVSHLVPPQDLETETLELARRIAKAAPLSVRNMKRTFYLLGRHPEPPGDVVQEMRGLEHQCFSSEDIAEGRLAFLQKREPAFKGK